MNNKDYEITLVVKAPNGKRSSATINYEEYK